MKGLRGDMLSTAVGMNPAPRGVAIPGDVRGHADELEGQGREPPGQVGDDPCPATKLPRCGVEMNTTRETSGSGSTNSPRRKRSRVLSDSCS